MSYREDCDLEFLSQVKSEDLSDLVHLLIYDKDGLKRFSEELSLRDSYIRYNPDHHQYWKDIAGELQCYGANSILTIFRGGKGVLYREILCDVCDGMKVEYEKGARIEKIEDSMLMEIIRRSFDKMSSDDMKDLAKTLGLKDWSSVTPQVLTGAIQAMIAAGGFASYQIAVIVANAVWKALFGAGLSFATNATITRALSVFAGPIGWIITGLWTIVDIAGPATRVTIPAAFLIALLRRKVKAGDNGTGNPSPAPKVPSPHNDGGVVKDVIYYDDD